MRKLYRYRQRVTIKTKNDVWGFLSRWKHTYINEKTAEVNQEESIKEYKDFSDAWALCMGWMDAWPAFTLFRKIPYIKIVDKYGDPCGRIYEKDFISAQVRLEYEEVNNGPSLKTLVDILPGDEFIALCRDKMAEEEDK